MKLVSNFISSLCYGLLVYCMLPSALSQTTVFPSPKRPSPLRSWCQTNRISALPPPPLRPSLSQTVGIQGKPGSIATLFITFQASAKAESAPSSHFQKSKILSPWALVWRRKTVRWKFSTNFRPSFLLRTSSTNFKKMNKQTKQNLSLSSSLSLF